MHSFDPFLGVQRKQLKSGLLELQKLTFFQPVEKFAMQEASYVTARLAQTMARVDSRDAAEPWREQITLTICSKAGVKVGLTIAPDSGAKTVSLGYEEGS